MQFKQSFSERERKLALIFALKMEQFFRLDTDKNTWITRIHTSRIKDKLFFKNQ